ncbi:AbrB/MazE/SpoVT family DNA-binding domain-containing protein [Marinomonas aquiplantarum]|uniref:Antitoxin MazE n=1 Tax=Marinomonas aquiplantarum TaxID=491951 RepID=A0A366D7B5_9GAMM|nr:AbrB/MazE/SpoVT family DNA-binding domain-containing protein [Marinomonas aquiplantarum]RBO85923.1 antitoxin MazE [Marinomonas aquiplantarum]
MNIDAEVKKWGNSLALRINAVTAEALNLHQGSKVTYEILPDGLLIKPVVDKSGNAWPYSESELLAGIDKNTAHTDELAALDDNEWLD